MRLGRLVMAWTMAAVSSLGMLTALHAHLASIGPWDGQVQAAVHAYTRPWVTNAMLALTLLGRIEVFVPAVAIATAVLAWTGRTRQAILLGGAIAGALLLNEGLKLHFHRLRPAVAWSIGDEVTYSFPSGHALFAAILYATLAYLAGNHRRYVSLTLAVPLPIGIGLSRIYLGMHYPSDVLAGYATGLIWFACLVWADQGTGAHSPAVRR